MTSDAVRALDGPRAPRTLVTETVPRPDADEIPVELVEDDRPTDPELVSRTRALGLLGQVLSQRYRIDELVGTGGMGAVYSAYHLLLQKRVAIKVLLSSARNQPELAARFQREAIAGSHVSHPNVAAATDLGQLEDGSYFLVLELVPGETLSALLKRERLSAVRAVAITRQIASGLAAIHALGIVHRDLKPSNVMLAEGPEDLVKIIDFGLAKVPEDPVSGPSTPVRRLTGVGAVFGTIAYLAPEAAKGMSGLDARADLYALGVILYRMLAGRHAFDAVEPAALFAQHRLQAPPPLPTTTPPVQPALEAIVMRLLAKDPAERYGTGKDLIEALDGLDAVTPDPEADTDRDPLVLPAPRDWVRSRLPLVLALAALVLTAALGTYVWVSSRSAVPHAMRVNATAG